MKTPPETLVSLAETLWQAGYRGDKQGRPLDKAKPLIPAVIANHTELPLPVAIRVNHLLAVWSIGTVAVGVYDEL